MTKSQGEGRVFKDSNSDAKYYWEYSRYIHGTPDF